MTRLLSIASLAAATFFVMVGGANAATRYAAYDSAVTSGTCASETPGCQLDYAINSAAANDTIVVLPGDYNVAWPILATQKVHVEGKAGEARPRLLGGAGLAGATVDLPKGGSIKHLYIESKSSFSALSTKGANISDVIVYSQASDAADAKADAGSVIRDSVFHTAAGSPYSALKLWDDQITGSIDVVNVTAVGTAAGSTGIANGSGGPVRIVNTIARGASSDITINSGVQNAQVSYSSYRPLSSTGVTAGAGNQSAAPLFDGAKPGEFRPAAGSPTIDAGTAGVTLGPDPDGTTRPQGSAPDIGAFEMAGAGGGGGGTGTSGTGDSGVTGTTTGPDTTNTTATTTNTTGTTTDTTDTTDTTGEEPAKGNAGQLPPAAPPVLGQSVGLGPVKGSVTVRLPGTRQEIPLEDGASVPVGSIVDASNGVVSLTSVRDRSGKAQTGRFWGGTFRVVQGRRDTYTELRLAGKAPSCASRSRVNTAGKRRKKSRKRRLWSRDRGGRFRTRGRNGSATVRGTDWYTEDRCAGTYFRVKRGKIVVRDKAKRKNVTLRRGDRYLARPRGKR